MKRNRKEKFGDINEAVVKWLRSCARSKNVRPSGTSIQKKASEIAKEIGIADFCASNGWLEKFRHRNNVVLEMLNGDLDLGKKF